MFVPKLLVVLSLAVHMAMATSATAQASTSLAAKARYVALHGGITGSCMGCATVKMKQLMVQVYEARFASSGSVASETAVCLMQHESGANPGAISSTDDYGGPQMHEPAHVVDHPEWFEPGRGFVDLIFDPWFGASQMWAMSSRGTDWSAWTGTFGRGECHFY